MTKVNKNKLYKILVLYLPIQYKQYLFNGGFGFVKYIGLNSFLFFSIKKIMAEFLSLVPLMCGLTKTKMILFLCAKGYTYKNKVKYLNCQGKFMQNKNLARHGVVFCYRLENNF